MCCGFTRSVCCGFTRPVVVEDGLDLCVVIDDVLERVGLDELLKPDLVQLEVRNRLSQLNTGHLCRNITTFKL